MAALERRIEDLEAKTPKRDMTPRIIRFVPPDGELGELLGYQIPNGDYVKRKAGESEEALLKRAVAIAKANLAPNSILVVIEDRAD